MQEFFYDDPAITPENPWRPLPKHSLEQSPCYPIIGMHNKYKVFYAALSGMLVLVEGPVLRKALKKFSEEILIVIGSIILIVIGSIILGTNFILLVSNEVILVYCATVLFAVGNGLMWPSVLSLLSKHAGSTHQGAV